MDIYERISGAGKGEIAAILDHVLLCYRELYPDWEISVVTVEKTVDKNEQLDRIITLLENMKEK